MRILYMPNYKLITDGAYSSSRNQGGIAFIFLRDNTPILEYSKMYKHCTNNQMEMIAIISGLKCIKKPIDTLTIISDSMYCVGCATLGWKRKKNVKLWKVFDSELDRVSKLCSNIEFKHVRGHQKDNSEETKWNNRCDELAVRASQKI
jgi:ribonuclease HI